MKPPGIRGLPPFLSMRAMIRAHVRAAADHIEEAKDYLCAARAYLSQPPAIVLAIGGLQARANRRWPEFWHQNWVLRRVRSYCAATKSANACIAYHPKIVCLKLPIQNAPTRQ